MAIPLRQSTASQEVLLGMFLDSIDGVTPKTALSIANTDIKIWKHGATTLASKTSGGATHISNGLYYIVLDATDTDTPGSFMIHCHVSGALPVRALCTVLPANIFDSLFGSDKLEVDIVQVAAAVVTDIDEFKADITQLTGIAGINATTLTITDGTDPLDGVSVAIYNSANTIFITSTTTNSSGVATVYLDDGSYKVRLSKAGYGFTNPESLTVSGVTTDTYTGEGVVTESAESCRLYEYCFAQDGITPLATVTSLATIRTLPYDYDNRLHSVDGVIGTYDATSGFLYWDIVRGCRVLVTITELGISSYVDIPDASTVRLANLL